MNDKVTRKSSKVQHMQDHNDLSQFGSADNIDIFTKLANTDLSKIDRSRPVIKGGTYLATIASMDPKETKPTEKNPNKGWRLQIGLKLEQTAECEPDEDGKPVRPVQPGFLLFDSVSLNPTEKYNPLERLADIQNAAFGQQKSGFNKEELIGCKVLVQVKVERSEEFGTQNRITRWVKRKDPSAKSAADVAASL